MPIYAYKCESCGLSKDVLQKISDAQLTDCPACGKATFKKQVTAAGFQLKGSGWYATDFKGGSTPAPTAPAGDAKPDTKSGGDSTSTGGGSDTKSAGDSPSTPSKTESTPPAASCGGGCACH